MSYVGIPESAQYTIEAGRELDALSAHANTLPLAICRAALCPEVLALVAAPATEGDES